MMRYSASFLALCFAGVSAGLAPSFAAAQAPTSDRQWLEPQWVMPRTPDGRPDLQGNWSNATITPRERPPGVGPVLTPDQVAEIEGTREAYIEEFTAASDPNREAPAVGGVATGDLRFDRASGGTGGYNYIYIDGGDRVAIYNGELRSSLVTNPADGRIPPLTPEARQRSAERSAFNDQFGPYDHPEGRPLGERCILWGGNSGPPMLPNYFYNNNYTIVQTPDHIMIMSEMVHDVRIIRMGERVPLPDHIRPWMGDSWGHWEGDTLVIETTNLHPLQRFNGNPTDNLKVIERLTRVDQSTINYEFTIIDPETYTAEWGGEVPMKALEGLIYEYACHEGNYSLAGILSGARYQERLEAENQR